jgi:hypothetical protein
VKRPSVRCSSIVRVWCVRKKGHPFLWHGLEWIPWRAAGADLDIWGRVSQFDSGIGGYLT